MPKKTCSWNDCKTFFGHEQQKLNKTSKQIFKITRYSKKIDLFVDLAYCLRGDLSRILPWLNLAQSQRKGEDEFDEKKNGRGRAFLSFGFDVLIGEKIENIK